MAFKWKSKNDKGDIISKDTLDELRKRINDIAHALLDDSDIPLPKWKSSDQEMPTLESLDEIRDNLDYINENNYCKSHGDGVCISENTSYDSGNYGAEKINDLSSRFASAEYTRYDAECESEFTPAHSDNDDTYNNALYGSHT